MSEYLSRPDLPPYYNTPTRWDEMSIGERDQQAFIMREQAVQYAVDIAPVLWQRGCGYASGKLPRHDDRMPQHGVFAAYCHGRQSQDGEMEADFDELSLMQKSGSSEERYLRKSVNTMNGGRALAYAHVITTSRRVSVAASRLSQASAASRERLERVYHAVVEPKLGWTQLDVSCMGLVKGDERDTGYTFMMLIPPDEGQEIIRLTTQVTHSAV